MLRSVALIAAFLFVQDALAQLRYDTLYTRQVGVNHFHSHILEHTQPWNIHVLEIDLTDENTQVKSIKAGESLYGFETTISMAQRFNEEGHRVVGAINADFFSGTPISMQLAQGEFVRREAAGRPGIGFNYQNDVMIEAPVFTSRLITEETEVTVHGVNESRGTNQMVLYNRFFGSSTNTNEHGSEIAIESLDGWRANDTLRVVVRAKQTDQGGMGISSGWAVLSGHGTSGAFLADNVAVGDTLRLALGVVPGINDLVEMVSGGPFLVRNGEQAVGPRGDGSDRHPRTSIGINADTTRLYLITVDGRQTLSAGMDLHELADFMIDIGVHTGINLDGGGSTTMVVRGRIDNSISGGNPGRAVTNALAVISTGPEGELDDVGLRHDTLKVFRGRTFDFLVDAWDEYFNAVSIDRSNVVWNVDPAVGAIDSDGRFTSTTDITSGYLTMEYGSYTDSTYIILKDIGELRVSPREVVLDTTRTFRFSVTTFDTDGARQTISGSEIDWSVVDESIGTVADDGTFRGRMSGQTGVVAHYGEHVTDTVFVEVQLGEGIVMLDELSSTEGWTLQLENVDPAGSGFAIEETEEGDVMRFDYRFTQGSASVFRMKVEQEFEVFGVPQYVHVDAKSDGLNHRVFFDIQDAAGTNITAFVPKFVNVTEWDSLWTSAQWSTMVPPIKVRSIGVQLGNTGVAGAVNEGSIYLRNLRVSYPMPDAVSSEPVEQPHGFNLDQNYPNPFNPTTTISYTLERAGEVTLRVFNVLGQEVARLVDGQQTAGAHQVLFDASSLPSGAYFYTLESGSHRVSRTMVLLK